MTLEDMQAMLELLSSKAVPLAKAADLSTVLMYARALASVFKECP